jgi:hypothetical protein
MLPAQRREAIRHRDRLQVVIRRMCGCLAIVTVTRIQPRRTMEIEAEQRRVCGSCRLEDLPAIEW